MSDLYLCTADDCGKRVTATKNQRYRTHTSRDGEKCENSSAEIPERELQAGAIDPKADPAVPEEGRDYATCAHCSKKVRLTANGYFEHHTTTLRGSERCLNAGVRFRPLRKTVDVPLPGDALPGKGVAKAQQPTVHDNMTAERNLSRTPFLQPGPVPDADSSASTETSSPESATTSNVSAELIADSTDDTGVLVPLFGGKTGRFFQPGSPFLQPGDLPGKAAPLTDHAAALAQRVKETFYAYSNRRTSDNRSAQTTLGPSEIGTTCDRRLAMALLGSVPVNPGGDGWAAFVGTSTHVGMAEVYEWANASTGRYAVEIPLTFGSVVVPKGTSDLLDRREGEIIDWKVMGAYSLKKFKAEGPSETYRIQGHVYGYGATLQGEKVRRISIVGLPRAGSSLDEMHVWSEKFDKKVALAAIARVEALDVQVQKAKQYDTENLMDIAREIPTGDAYECRFCPFFLKGDKEMLKGCPGV